MSLPLLLLLFSGDAPAVPEASPPAESRPCERVAVLVLNRHRHCHESTDYRGRPVVSHSEQWWWSAWDQPLGWWSPPGTWIGRGPTTTCGWWTFRNSCLLRCSDGWMLSTTEGDVVAPVVLVVDSPWDFEVKFRTVIVPLFK